MDREFMEALIKTSKVRIWFKHLRFKLIKPCLAEKIRKRNEAADHSGVIKSTRVRDLMAAVQKSWCRETCYPHAQQIWSPKHPGIGQCAPTALVIQDYLNGDILYCKHVQHYWNRLPEGVEMDATGRRFADDSLICPDATVHRSEFTNLRDANTLARYVLLKHRVEQNLEASRK